MFNKQTALTNEEMELEAKLDSDSGDDWDEDESSIGTITCLFCKEQFPSYSEATAHLDVVHEFSLSKIVRKLGLDDYSYRKLVNYIRLKNAGALDIISMKDSKNWNSDDYLAPVIQDDAWLMLGTEVFIY